jgi:type II secretory pathway pseudopilin PulG
MKVRFSNTKGFSLPEMIIYVALLALMFLAIMNAVLGMGKGVAVLGAARMLNNSALSSMERMVREIRQASSVDQGQSTFNANPGKLVLNTTDSGGNSTTVEFSVSSTTLIVKQGGITLGPLTIGSTTVDSLIFRSIATSTSQAVRVEMTLTSQGISQSKTGTFYSTAVLRGSY